MEGKSASNTFLKILQCLSSKNSNIRYHSQFALRRIFNSNPSAFFIEFSKIFETEKILEQRPLSELAYAFSKLETIEDLLLPQINSILSSIENISEKMNSISFPAEIISVAMNFFTLKPNLLMKMYKNLQILTALTVSQMITSSTNEELTNKIIPILLSEKCKDSVYSIFARSRLIAAISMYAKEVSTDVTKMECEQSEMIIDFFIGNPQTQIAPFIPTLVSQFPTKEEKRKEYFKNFVKICSSVPSISVFMVPSAVSVTDHSEEESLSLMESIVPTLSIVPFHFSSTLPDDAAVNGFNVSVRAINNFITQETSSRLTKFIVNAATSGELNQRLGFDYALTCLVKLKALLDYDQLKKCFHRVSTPLEAGTLAELALALISNGKQIMTWADMIMFFEDCYGASNEISEQFVLDASTLLGKHIDAPVADVLQFISHCVFERFQFASVHFAVLNAFMENNKIETAKIPPLLLMHLCLFISLNPQASFSYLNTIEPLLKTPLQFVETLDPNLHSQAARQMLDRFNNDEQKRTIIIEFLVHLTKNATKQEAESNASKVVDLVGNDVDKNLELVSSLYAAFATVDCHLATQHLQSFIQSQNRGWFLFGSNAKSSVTIKLVFITLSKLKIHITPFIQFATEHLPDSSNPEVCAEIIHTLAVTLRGCEEIRSEFPPKCRLFDFVSSSSSLCNDDVFRCIGELLTISPICQIEHIPLVTKLCNQAKEITEDLLFMLQRAVEIVESPGDMQMLIEPFVVTDTSSIQYQLLLSVLEAFIGDKHNSQEFQSLLDYNASAKLESFDSSFDNFLSLVARIVGLYIPIFEKAHLAVEFTLRLMARLTKKIEVKQQLSLQEAVKCISISFNSQCLFEATELICKNLTITSVTSFLILFNERESELLHCAQPFIQNILTEQESKASLVFDANETLAKAAAAMLTVQQFPILKLALKTSRYKAQIIEILLEYTATKYEMILSVVNDEELKDVLDQSLPEVQYSKARASEQFNIDCSNWTTEQSMKFIDLVGSTLDAMPQETQIRFANQLAKFKDEEAIPHAIGIFEPLFKSENPFSFMGPFAANPQMIPILIKQCPDGKVFRGMFTLALANTQALPYLISSLPKMLDWVLKHSKVINLLKKQKDVTLLRPFLPRLVSALLQNEQTQKDIMKLIQTVTGINDLKAPTAYVGLFELCDSIKFCEPSAECVISLMKKARSGDHASLVVLCCLAQKQLLERENYKEVHQLSNSLLEKDDDEDAQIAALACSACFPLQI